MNHDDTTSNNDDLVVCEDCGTMVPPANMQMHQLRGCPNRKRPAVSRSNRSSNSGTANTSTTTTTSATAVNSTAGPPSDRVPAQNPDFVDSHAATGSASRQSGAGASVPVVQGVVLREPHQPSTPPAPARAYTSSSTTTTEQQQSSPWDRISSALSPTLRHAIGGWADPFGEVPVSSASATATAIATPVSSSSRYPATRRRQRPPDSPDADILQVTEVVNLAGNDSSSSSSSRGAAVSSRNNQGRSRSRTSNTVDLVHIHGEDSDEDAILVESDEDEADHDSSWSCPRCTLRNPEFQAVCDACLYSRRTQRGPPDEFTYNANGDCVRPADATHTEQLIPTFLYNPSDFVPERTNTASASNNDSTAARGSSAARSSYVPQGAIVGSVLGAAGALVSGQPASRVARASIDGAVGGAMGGLAMDVVLQDRDQRTRQQQQSQSQRRHHNHRHSSSSNTNHTSSNRHRQHRAPSEPQIRVYQTPGGGLVISRRSGSGSHRPQSLHSTLPDPMMEFLMHQSMMGAAGGGHGHHVHRGGSGGGEAGMNYEQLLHMFGDGTENLGATAGQIASLPTATVSDSNKNGKKGGQCSICLQDFEEGDTFKTLPCLHSSFHSACIDRWLKTNAACPICKHRLE